MADFYTRRGDDGSTSLLGEGRVPKHHARTEAYGAADEASAALGVARAMAQSKLSNSIARSVQKDLYKLMAEVAATPENAARFRAIEASQVAWLEEQIEHVGGQVEIPSDFVLSGASAGGAAFDLARTIVRRAERRVVRLFYKGELENQALVAYLNRLSSLCFVLSLWEDKQAGINQPELAKEGDSEGKN